LLRLLYGGKREEWVGKEGEKKKKKTKKGRHPPAYVFFLHSFRRFLINNN
jgi:hypothetical protein